MTVMHSRRVLEYGYPKAWDGRNMVYDLLHDDKQLGLDKKTGAFIGGSGWGHYYFLAPVMAFADGIEDIYLKTGLIRGWFALAGLAGMLLFGIFIYRLFRDRREALVACIIFVGLSALSIPLLLHMRDARYYSLVILLTAALSVLYFRHRWVRPMKAWKFGVWLFVLLTSLLITFSPGYFAFVGALFVMELMRTASKVLVVKEGTLNIARNMLVPVIGKMVRQNVPVAFSLLPLIPFFNFFNTFEINRRLLQMNVQIQPYAHYLGNLKTVMGYLVSFEPAWLLLFLKALQIVFLKGVLRSHATPGNKARLLASVFLTVLALAYVFFASRVPNFPFTRYFITAIPLMAVIISLDTLILYRTLRELYPLKRKAIVTGLSSACVLVYSIILPHNAFYIRGHVYEMFHAYKGHLDYIIPWVLENYPDRRNLVIAANYEESSFMFYTDARVTVGYVQANLLVDASVQPDIIYFSPQWTWGADERLLADYLARGTYKKMYFPVAKYRVNNIPEVNHQPEITHQFHTLLPAGREDMAEILVKVK